MSDNLNLNGFEQVAKDFLSGKISAAALCDALPRSSGNDYHTQPRLSLTQLRLMIDFLTGKKAYEQAGALLDVAEESFTSIPSDIEKNPRFGITRLRINVLIASNQPDAACEVAFKGILTASGQARLTPMRQWISTLVRVGRKEEALERLAHAFSQPLYRDDLDLNILNGKILLDLGNPHQAIRHVTEFRRRTQKATSLYYPIFIQSHLRIGDRIGLKTAERLAEKYFQDYPSDPSANMHYIMAAKHGGDLEIFIAAIDRVIENFQTNRESDSTAKLLELREKAPQIISVCAKPEPMIPAAIENSPTNVQELLRELFRPLAASGFARNAHMYTRPVNKTAGSVMQVSKLEDL